MLLFISIKTTQLFNFQHSAQYHEESQFIVDCLAADGTSLGICVNNYVV
jgi:hypothetical protein